MECFEKLIKKDWLHPLTGEKLTDQDIIPLQRVRIIIYYIVKYYIFIYILLLSFLLGWNGVCHNKCEFGRKKCKTSSTSLKNSIHISSLNLNNFNKIKLNSYYIMLRTYYFVLIKYIRMGLYIIPLYV